MGEKVSDILLHQLSDFVSEHMGLHFPDERLRYLEHGLVSASVDFGFDDSEACGRWLISTPLNKNQIEVLASHLTVGETYFFRESKDFEIFERHLFSELIRSRQERDKYLRIWCAGCATGEEPYSVAILLSRMLPDLKEWHITILATDINKRFLKKASEGVYTDWSFRNTPPWVRDGYFEKKGRNYTILPRIRKMVTFSYLNLVEDVFPALMNNTNAMDVIFCRNVLMYFSGERIKKVAGNIYKSLVDKGWFIVSPAEASREFFQQFASVRINDIFLYRKEQKEKGREQTPALQDHVLFRPAPELRVPEQLLPEPVPVMPVPEPEPAPAAQEATEPDLLPLYTEALALYEQGFYAEAAEKIAGCFSAAQEGEKSEMPGYAGLAGLLARSYANQGGLEDALLWCEKAIAADKLCPTCYYLRATILQEMGQSEDAVRSLRQAVYLDPDFVLAYFALGNISMQADRFREADRYFDNALSLLANTQDKEILPESEGMTAGRIKEIIESMKYRA